MKIVAFMHNNCYFLDDIVNLMNNLKRSDLISEVYLDIDLSQLEAILYKEDKNNEI